MFGGKIKKIFTVVDCLFQRFIASKSGIFNSRLSFQPPSHLLSWSPNRQNIKIPKKISGQKIEKKNIAVPLAFF